MAGAQRIQYFVLAKIRVIPFIYINFILSEAYKYIEDFPIE